MTKNKGDGFKMGLAKMLAKRNNKNSNMLKEKVLNGSKATKKKIKRGKKNDYW